jgi:Sensors of blue-light using FAD
MMPEASADSTFRLIYRSRNRIPEPDRKAELGAIFSVARSGNRRKQVTGALLTHGDWFVQALEGDEGTVRDLYEHIFKDHRHERVTVLFAEPVEDRVFSRWAMAKVAEDGKPDIPLLMNIDKGGISPAARRPTTPEQDKILDFMRDAIRG